MDATSLPFRLVRSPRRSYDARTRQWTKLADIAVGFPMWSSDSKYVYFDSTESVPKLYRVRIADRSLEHVARLQGIRLSPSKAVT